MIRLLLSKAQIAEIREGLLRKREQACEAIAQAFNDSGSSQTKGIPAPGHAEADANTGELRTYLQLLDYQRNLVQIEDINCALAALDEGTFGICLGCGGPIERSRLENNPALRACLSCRQAPAIESNSWGNSLSE